jgi:hypothetical protein
VGGDFLPKIKACAIVQAIFDSMNTPTIEIWNVMVVFSVGNIGRILCSGDASQTFLASLLGCAGTRLYRGHLSDKDKPRTLGRAKHVRKH